MPRRWLVYLAAAGPGLIAAAAGNDAGGIVTYSSAGAQFVYRTLFLMVLITVAYVVVQEMVARLSVHTGKGLAALIREEFSLRLTAFAIIAFAIAFPMAMAAAKRPNRLFDQASNSTTFAMLALPPFVIAPVLVLLFAVHWHIFPGPASYVPITENFWSNIHTMLLPSIVLALGSIVVYFRLLRNDLISTLQEDFITMARSKGLSDRRIMWRHALRPSSVSLLASAGVTIGSLIAGTFIVELLLQMPGLGYQLISSVNQDDYTVVQGITLFVAVAIVLINFIFDFLFTIVDPRIARE